MKGAYIMDRKEIERICKEYALFDYEEQKVELFIKTKGRKRAEVEEFIKIIIALREKPNQQRVEGG